MNEPIEAIAVIEPERGITQQQSGALVGMPVMEIAQLVERHKLLQQLVKELMVEDQDFGQIPGTQGKVLYKPGAEKLAIFFGLSPNLMMQEKIERWDKENPFFHYRYRCDIWAGQGSGRRIVASCEGSANSNETKWRYVWVDTRKKPNDEEATLLKAQGVGRFRKDDKEKWNWQERIENPRLFDQVNTINKIAQKRAIVGAVIFATNATGFFKQIEEDDHIDPVLPEPPRGKSNSGKLNGEKKDGPTEFWQRVSATGISREDATGIAKEAIDGRISWEQAIRRLPSDKAIFENEFYTKAKAAGMSNAEIKPILELIDQGEITWQDATNQIKPNQE